jgi:hypothetical protein
MESAELAILLANWKRMVDHPSLGLFEGHDLQRISIKDKPMAR